MSSRSGSTSEGRAGAEPPAAWLCRGNDILAVAELASGRRARRRGVRGRDEMAGALLIMPCRQVHTFGVRFPLDVAFCDEEGVVLDIVTVPPRRMTMPRLRSRFVVEARAGAFDRWAVTPGDRLEVLTGDRS